MKDSSLGVLLDANVLYSGYLRDLLLTTARMGIFYPRWSEEINREWSENLLKNRPDLSRAAVERTINTMNRVFRDANVANWEPLISNFQLPDPNDRHVLAAAVQSDADILLTFNRKDFPRTAMTYLSLEVMSPNEFFRFLKERFPADLDDAFEKLLHRFKHPPLTHSELVQVLHRAGFTTASEIFSGT